MPRLSRHLTPSLLISLLALVIATSSGAYAAAVLRNGEVKTRHLANGAVTAPKLGDNAVGTDQVRNFSLKLNDLTARGGLLTETLVSPVTVPGGQCLPIGLALYNPAPAGLVGSLVVGYVTDADGEPVMDNSGVVTPTVISETSQDGAIANLVVCAESEQLLPAGSVFHYRVISPGR